MNENRTTLVNRIAIVLACLLTAVILGSVAIGLGLKAPVLLSLSGIAFTPLFNRMFSGSQWSVNSGTYMSAGIGALIVFIVVNLLP